MKYNYFTYGSFIDKFFDLTGHFHNFLYDYRDLLLEHAYISLTFPIYAPINITDICY